MKLTKKLLSLLIVVFLSATTSAKPLKVVVLCGQSNMQGNAQVSTFEVMGMDPETAPILKEMLGEDGSPRVMEDVWISSIGSSEEEKIGRLTAGFGVEKRGPKIGPEFTFGIYLHKQLQEPILIIKTAWGGKSLHTDFRPPSAGAFVFNEEQLEKLKAKGRDIEKVKAESVAATGHYYRLMIEQVEKVLGDIKRVYPDYDAKEGYELAGFVWFQGWNDLVATGVYPERGKPGGYDAYTEVLAHFIRDVREDLDAPGLPFVIGVLGTGGPTATFAADKQRNAGFHAEFRKAMAAPAAMNEFKGNVAAVWTDQYWDMELEGLRREDQKLQKEIKAMVKDGQLEASGQKAALEKKRVASFDARQRKLLSDGVSNAEYHYLGSAKIFAGIGKGFAEALGEMLSD